MIQDRLMRSTGDTVAYNIVRDGHNVCMILYKRWQVHSGGVSRDSIFDIPAPSTSVII